MEGEDLIGEVMLFHNRGAATAKAPSPLSSGLDGRTARSSKSVDLRDFEVE